MADLDTIVAQVTAMWRLKVDSVFAPSSEGLVLAVRQENGTKAVLKLGLPGVDLGRQAHVCRLAGGGVFPKVLAHDQDFNALLLETFGRSIGKLNWSPDSEMQAVCHTLQCLWRTPVTGADFSSSGRSHAYWMRNIIERKYRELPTHCEVETRDLAIDYAMERADSHQDTAGVFVHGDIGRNNVVTLLDGSEAPGAECRLIDPIGIYAEPACDLAVFMKGPHYSWPLNSDLIRLARERCARLAELSGANERAIWQWGFVGRVVLGLTLTEERGTASTGAFLLGIANVLARMPPP